MGPSMEARERQIRLTSMERWYWRYYASTWSNQVSCDDAVGCGGLFNGTNQRSIQYFYDDLGRLTRVVDQSGNVATYTYDAVGNILKISRSTLGSPNTLAILNFTPSQ